MLLGAKSQINDTVSHYNFLRFLRVICFKKCTSMKCLIYVAASLQMQTADSSFNDTFDFYGSVFILK